MPKYREEFYLDGERLFATEFAFDGDPVEGLGKALLQAHETALKFALAANKERKRKDRFSPGDVELRVIRTDPPGCFPWVYVPEPKETKVTA